MAKTLLSSLAIVLALASMPLFAQTTTETPPADAVSPDGLSLGTEVGGNTGVGSTYVAASFEAWEQRCVRTESGIDPCQLYMLLKDEQGNSVAEFTLFGLPKGGQGPAVAGATFIAPLETLLTAGMMLQIDTDKPKAYPFTFCAQIGCVSRLGFTAEEVAQFKKGANAVINIVPFVAPDKKVTLTLSLKGFTAGFDAVNAANEKADAAAAAAKAADPADAPTEAPKANP